MRHFCFALAAILALTLCISRGQETPVAHLSGFIRSNETFGRRLLAELHSDSFEKNVVVSPLGVSISFAPIREGSFDLETLKEIDKVLGWEGIGDLDLSSKMLLARFDDDKTKISTRFLFRRKAPISTDYLKTIKGYFGVDWQTVDDTVPQDRVLSQEQGPSFRTPTVEGEQINNFWIVNRTDLDATWTGNTFAMGAEKVGSFTLASGIEESTPMLVSELSDYQHEKTANFEAIRLDCGQEYMLILLPRPGEDVGKLEKSLAYERMLAESNFSRQVGDIELPIFHLQYETNLRPALEKMGMKRVFTNMNALARLSSPGAMLQGFSQTVDMKLDRQGIHAHAFTAGGGIAGGVLGGSYEPFHMIASRPFLFFVRDRYTDSLLFAGVVMDPHKN